MVETASELPLRDIHWPDPVSWWPPAPGWWLVALFVMIFSALLYFFIKRHLAKKRSLHRLAIKALNDIEEKHKQNNDPGLLIRELSGFFRRVAVQEGSRSDIASLTGQEWSSFLDENMEGQPFSNGIGKKLLDSPYQKQIDLDEQALLTLCRQWVETRLQKNHPSGSGSGS